MNLRPLAVTAAAILALLAGTVAPSGAAGDAPRGQVPITYPDEGEHLISGYVNGAYHRWLSNVLVTATLRGADEPAASAITYGGLYELSVPDGTYDLRYHDLSNRFPDPPATREVVVAGHDPALPDIDLLFPAAVPTGTPRIVGTLRPGGTLRVAGEAYTGTDRTVETLYQWKVAGRHRGFRRNLPLGRGAAGQRVTVTVTATADRSWPVEYTLDTVRVARARTHTRIRGVRVQGPRMRVVVRVAGNPTAGGRVRLYDGRRPVARARLKGHTATLTLRRPRPGRHALTARFAGNKTSHPSRSRTVRLTAHR